ncbi:MAG: hypothetical protein ABW321_20480, partial [Polyangiales bacterium]
MTTKIWGGVLSILALTSGCNDAANAVPPTAAAGSSAQAGTSAAPAPTAPTPGPTAGSSSTPTPAAPSGGAAGAPSAPGGSGGAAATSGEVTAPTPGGADDDDAGTLSPTQPDPETGFDYPSGEVALDADLVIPAGKTVKVGPGTTFKAASGVKVQVSGELFVMGSADSRAAFVGSGAPRSWHGIVVESGGKLSLQNAQISGATYGLFVHPGAEFSVDSSIIDTSFKAAVIQSNGSFTRTRFVATVPETVSLASEVSVDDPNGALT